MNLKQPAAVFVLFALISHNLLAEGPVAKPSLLKAEKLEAMDTLFLNEVSEGRIVGCQALIFQAGETRYSKCFGFADREKELVMEDDAIFRIYSMSKPITSVAAMKLVEDGKLKLDAPISDYLPEFADVKVFAEGAEKEQLEVTPTQAITVRDLLRHTSGLTYGFFGDTEVDQRYRRAGILSRDADLAAMVSNLSKIPLLHQPGTKFHYSVSTDVLGRIVEVVSHQSLAEFMQSEIFEPLAMNDTFFSVPKEKQERLTQMYSPGSTGLHPANPLSSWGFVNGTKFYSGGGGLCSTAHDYLQFCQMMLNEGELNGERILKAETVQEMTRNQLPGAGRFQFGLGVSIDNDGSYGWGGAAGTRFWIDPERQVVGIFMVQEKPYKGANYENKMKKIVSSAIED